MEIKIKCNEAFIPKLKEYYSCFGFIQTNVRKASFSEVETIFYIERELEDKEKIIMRRYKLSKFLPIMPLIIFCILGFILTTAFLITRFASGIDTMMMFYSLMIPAIIFVLLATIYSCVRMLNINNNVKILTNLNMIKSELFNSNDGGKL